VILQPPRRIQRIRLQRVEHIRADDLGQEAIHDHLVVEHRHLLLGFLVPVLIAAIGRLGVVVMRLDEHAALHL